MKNSVLSEKTERCFAFIKDQSFSASSLRIYTALLAAPFRI